MHELIQEATQMKNNADCSTSSAIAIVDRDEIASINIAIFSFESPYLRRVKNSGLDMEKSKVDGPSLLVSRLAHLRKVDFVQFKR